MRIVADCNNFCCSCERLFRPDPWNKPVVELRNVDGCIVSGTHEAKKAEVGMEALENAPGHDQEMY